MKGFLMSSTLLLVLLFFLGFFLGVVFGAFKVYCFALYELMNGVNCLKNKEDENDRFLL